MAEPIDLSSIKEAKQQGGVDLASPAQRLGREFLQAIAAAGEGPVVFIGLTQQGVAITHTCSNSIVLRGLVAEALDMAVAGMQQQAQNGGDNEPRPTAT